MNEEEAKTQATPDQRVLKVSARSRNGVLFKLRLIREGKWHDYRARIRGLAAEFPGENIAAVVWFVRREFGYAGGDEMELLRESIIRPEVLQRSLTLKQSQRKYKQKVRQGSITNAIKRIKKANAPPEEENDWIQSHPKLFEALDRMGDDPPVELVARDIKDAPSRAAVNKLRAALRDPDRYYGKLHDAHKAKTAGDGAEADAVVHDMNLDMIDEMIKQASG
jgi:hypothetical protein